MLRKCLIFTFAAFLGCSEIPVDSLKRLSQFDLQSADLAKMRIIAELPDYPNVPKGGVALEVVANPENGIAFGYRAASDNRVAIDQLSNARRHRLAFALAAEDADLLDKFRARIAFLKAEGVNVRGSLKISAIACVDKQFQDGPALMSVWLDVGEDAPILLQTNRDLKALVNDAGEITATHECGY